MPLPACSRCKHWTPPDHGTHGQCAAFRFDQWGDTIRAPWPDHEDLAEAVALRQYPAVCRDMENYGAFVLTRPDFHCAMYDAREPD